MFASKMIAQAAEKTHEFVVKSALEGNISPCKHLCEKMSLSQVFPSELATLFLVFLVLFVDLIKKSFQQIQSFIHILTFAE